jgi:penicillin-binding protein 1C
LAKVDGGTAPFTWLANGTPVALSLRDRAVMLPGLGAGFVTLSVIDAEGRSARSTVRLR